MKHISRTVWILSIISLMTDMASEMLYPIMPAFLKSIGFSVLFIGVLEGLAEATAGLSKGYFGRLSDISARRIPFVQWGYAISALSKPMMAFFIQPVWIFFSRTMDRFGKGIRTGARDALLSQEATSQTKGRIFGFHRSMDTVGAALGPLLALVYLYYNPADYKTLFYLAFVPGFIAIMASFLLKEKNNISQKAKTEKKSLSLWSYWKKSPKSYKTLVVGLLGFALFNSSDMFLLLRIKESGVSDTYVVGAYIFYNLVYALFAFPAGALADKVGMKKVFIIGLLLFAVVYAGMSHYNAITAFIALFFLYGIFAAATDGVSKAWISGIISKEEAASGLGLYAGMQSIVSLLSSSITGLIWYAFSGEFALAFSAIGSGLTIFYVIFFLKYSDPDIN